MAFYVIAFSEAFDPLIRFLHYEIHIPLIDKRWIGLASMGILSVLILTRGANLGMKALYLVASILGVSLIMFFIGKNGSLPVENAISKGIENPANFFFVFTIV